MSIKNYKIDVSNHSIIFSNLDMFSICYGYFDNSDKHYYIRFYRDKKVYRYANPIDFFNKLNSIKKGVYL